MAAVAVVVVAVVVTIGSFEQRHGHEYNAQNEWVAAGLDEARCSSFVFGVCCARCLKIAWPGAK